MTAAEPTPSGLASEAGALDPPVVFYDGDCGLCHRSVDFLLSHDRLGRLRFSPLQGEAAAEHLPPERLRDLDSVCLIDSRGLHLRSSAILRALVHMGGAWRLMRVVLLVPAPLRDAAYNFIARNRIQWFGRPADACRLPSPDERERFLP